jgi:hypothetical protein
MARAVGNRHLAARALDGGFRAARGGFVAERIKKKQCDTASRERRLIAMPSGDKKSKPIAIVTYPGVGLLDLVATKTVLDSLANPVCRFP